MNLPTSTKVNFSQSHDYTNQDRYLWTQAPSVHFKAIYNGDIKNFQSRLCSVAGFQYIPQFAFYPHKTNVTNARAVNVLEVIRIIKSERLKTLADQIKEARELGNDQLRTKLKDELPYITHAGIFIPRRNDGLILPGFTYQLDIDKIQNADKVLEGIINDRELDVLFACKSVSGNGVKAMLFLKELVFLKDLWTHEQYRQTYHKATEILSAYFKEKHGVSIDTQMKAISQPFYLFSSPNLHVHKNLSQWV
jgi:VirE N-terminal domain